MEIDMTFSIAEMFLLVWAILATVAYGNVSSRYRMHRAITSELLVKIAEGKIKVTTSGDSIDFVEV
jgi:hypothetical protein